MNINDLQVRKSRNGNGIFTLRDFVAEEKIFEVTGDFVSCDVEEKMEDEVRNNTYRFDKDKFISPGNTIGKFLNHSCEPNAKIVKEQDKLFVVAIDDIKSNQEIFFDYSTVGARDDIWQMEVSCNCGSKNCRKIIADYTTLPREVLDDYKKRKIIPDYILEI
jgi:hypothetical protein